MDQLTFVIAIITSMISVGLASWYIWQYASGVRLPKLAERSYMDPLPPLVRLIWPVVAFFIQLLRDDLTEKKAALIQAKIDSSGLRYTIRPEEFIALRYACATLGLCTGAVCALMDLHTILDMPFMLNVFIGAAFGVLGYFYPESWFNGARKKYTKDVMRSLPGYLDMITMCCEAGLNLNGAIQQAVNKGKDGALRRELERVLREVRAGVVRTEALRNMAERMDNPAITNLVSNIIQSELMGASLAITLRSISDMRRMERFQIAEKAAMEAPVKMIFPLVMFIFPVTFMIIAFPLIMKAKEVL